LVPTAATCTRLRESTSQIPSTGRIGHLGRIDLRYALPISQLCIRTPQSGCRRRRSLGALTCNGSSRRRHDTAVHQCITTRTAPKTNGYLPCFTGQHFSCKQRVQLRCRGPKHMPCCRRWVDPPNSAPYFVLELPASPFHEASEEPSMPLPVPHHRNMAVQF
jgi:hypothetical protein